MFSLFIVMVGGSIGAGGRYLVGRWLAATLGTAYPWGTLAVNLVGGLAMGLLVGWVAKMPADNELRLFLAVGVLGGFTTFSAFSLDMVAMIERGALAMAMGYALLSVIGAAAALFGGLAITRGLA